IVQNKCVNNFIRYVPGINLFEKIRLNSEDITPRAFHSGNVISEDNKKSIIVFGGMNEKDEILDETFKFDFQAKKWERVESTTKPSARYKHASFNFNDAIFIHGGLNPHNAVLSDFWHSAQLFDNEWMIIYGGITNGWIENYALSDMYALNIYTFSWFEVDISTSKSFNRGYYGSLCLVPYKKSLHIFGGTDESSEFSDAFSMSPLVTYVSYKTLTGKFEQLNTKMKNIDENLNDNDHVNLAEFELKIAELKEDVNNINNMMKTFEMKFSALEKLNEQCEKLLSKNMNAEALEKLEQRIRKLESSNVLMKHDSI
ncbi:kelch domain-containing protein, partial [Plasmodium cynomolgi strain B]